jgi:hypothetical protein
LYRYLVTFRVFAFVDEVRAQLILLAVKAAFDVPLPYAFESFAVLTRVAHTWREPPGIVILTCIQIQDLPACSAFSFSVDIFRMSQAAANAE